MTILEKVRNYFMDCPLMDGYKINVDYLGVEAVEYTIDTTPTSTVIKPYADGGALKQFSFVIGSRNYYGADVMNNIENSGFYEALVDWFDEQNKIGNLPVLSGGKVVNMIEALTPGYLFGVTEDTARYQIQCRIVYYEDK